MFFSIIMLPAYVIVIAAIMYNNHTATRQEGNLLLGVTIPKVEMQRTEVVTMVTQFKKKYKFLSLIFGILVIPTFPLSTYPITSCMYMYVWMGLYLLLNQLLLNHAFDSLYQFKLKQGWVIGEQHTITVDTEVTRLKNKLIYPKSSFIFSSILTLIAAYLWLPSKEDSFAYYTISLSIILVFITSIILYISMSRIKAKAYSQDTQINLAINKSYRYETTKACVWIGISNAIIWLICGIFHSKDTYIIMILVAASLTAFVGTGLLIYAYHAIRKIRLQFDRTNPSPIVCDDDIYWRGGIYNNPNDKSIMVEKRIGIGTSINQATKAGKIINFSVAVIILFCIALTVYVWPMDFPTLSVTINENTLTIDASTYDYELSLSDIQAITVLDKMPSSDKNVGANTDTYYFGKFRVKGYGQSQVYIYRKKPPFIVLTTPDTYLFVNCNTTEETFKLLNQISDATHISYK